MNLTEFKELVTEMVKLLNELKAAHAADPRPNDHNKVSVWQLLVGVLFGKNPV